MKFRCIAIFALGSISAQVCAEMPLYRATQFSLPWDATVLDSNSRGDVLYLRSSQGLLRTYVHSIDGSIRLLPAFTPEGYGVIGTALDDNGNFGVMIGDAPGRLRVGYWNESEGFRVMPYPPGIQFSEYGIGDMNNSGVLAWYVQALTNGDRGTWNVNTNEVVQFPSTAGSNTELLDISESGFTTGRGAFSPFGAVFHPDGTGYRLQAPGGINGMLNLSGATLTVSNTGIVVGDGRYDLSTGTIFGTYVWDSAGNLIEANTNQGFIYSGISGSNLITGYTLNDPAHLRPFLYELGGERVLIENRIVERNFAGDLFGNPVVISDNHAIMVAQGGGQVNVPRTYTFLEPVPEPGTVLALGAGLAALLRRRRIT